MLLTGGILLHNLPMACLLRSNEIVSEENESRTKYSSDESHNDKTSDVALIFDRSILSLKMQLTYCYFRDLTSSVELINVC
jgi:hypothetical protein